MEKLEDITKSMRQWVERIGPIPNHEIVAKVFDWARRIETCKNEVKPSMNATWLRTALSAIEDNIKLIQSSTKSKNWKTLVLMQCTAINGIIQTALEKPSRNIDRAECDTCDHAAAVFAKETGYEMPENPSDARMILWMNSFCHWLFDAYKKDSGK